MCHLLDALLVSPQRLLKKLENVLHQPHDYNLQLTGILSRLAQCPSPLIHGYLFPAAAMSTTEPVAWVSLIDALKKV